MWTITKLDVLLIGVAPMLAGIGIVVYYALRRKDKEKITLEIISSAEVLVRGDGLYEERFLPKKRFWGIAENSAMLCTEHNLTKKTDRTVLVIEESSRRYKLEVQVGPAYTLRSNFGNVFYLHRDKFRKDDKRYRQLSLKEVGIVEGSHVELADMGKVLSQLLKAEEEKMRKKKDDPLLFGMTRGLMITLIVSFGIYTVITLLNLYITWTYGGAVGALVSALHAWVAKGAPVP